MDETPIKAGRAGPGKMKSGYFWPVYGERDEICFVYDAGRGGQFIEQTLGLAVLLVRGWHQVCGYRTESDRNLPAS